MSWLVIGHIADQKTIDLMNLIESKAGERPKLFAMYSTMMAFIRHSGLNENEPVAYNEGNLVGYYDQVLEYFQTEGIL